MGFARLLGARRGLVRSARALAAAALLALSGALAPPAAAQDRVLVSDLGHPPDIDGGYASGAELRIGRDIPAQPFHVGADQGNYTLTSVEIPFVSVGIAAADIEKLSVSIWYSDSWDYELVNNELFTNVGFVGCPWPCQPVPLGYQLYTLENPPSIPDPPDSAEATTATFTVPEGAPLLAGKTYAVVVSYDKRKSFGKSAPYWQTLETIVRVDAASAEGWDIPNENWCSPMVQPGCANASDATWQTADSNVHRLGVNGYVGSRFADDNVCPNPLSPPVSVRAYPTLPYQIHLGWWSPDTTHGARNRPVCYDYQYRYRILGANTWTSEWKTVAEEFLPSPNDTEIRNYNSLEVTDLISGRTYEFQVRTVRGGPYSESVSILATAAGGRRISIEAASGPVTEGEPVRFTVSRHEPFGRANGRLSVFVTVSETGEMIERGRNWNYRNVEFADGQTTAELVLETVDDGDADEPDSEVTAKVRRSNSHPYGYLYGVYPGRGSATKTVTARRGGTIPSSSRSDLTAEFVGMPTKHDGDRAFRFRVAFSENIGISYRSLREDAFTVTGGRVVGGKRVDDRRDLFRMTVEPDGDGDVTITLPEGRKCGVSGAICTKGKNRRRLTNTPSATVRGPASGMDFAHFAKGVTIASEMVLVNAAPHPSRPAIYFYDTKGDPIPAESVVDLTGDLEVTEDGALTVWMEMEPLAELTISTHGRGEPVSGSVTVLSDGPIGGVVRYSVPEIGVAGVGPGQPTSDALFPVRRQAGGIRTAAALHNLEAEAMGVNCRLMSGGVALEEVEIPLEANGQASWFIEDTFTATDTSDFLGSVRCTAPGNGRFTAVALEMDAANRIFTTLPVVPVDPPGSGNQQTTLDFAHFANGTGITSEMVFLNPSTQPSRPAVYFYDTEGAPIAAYSVVDVTGDLEITEDGALTVWTEMEPLGVLTISTHGRGELVTGSVRVVSDGPIGGLLRFEHPGVGAGVVGASLPLSDAIFPVRRQEGGINTWAAIHNLESSAGLLRCDLMREGVLLDAVSIPLEANGQTAWFIDQAFPAADTSDFAGSVRCDAVGEGRFSAVALEMDPGNRIFTTLPVVPVPEMPDQE